MRPRSLLLLGYVAVIAILFVSGVVIAFRTRSGMQTTIAHDAETVASSLMDEIDRAVWSRVQTIRAFAGTATELHDLLEESNAAAVALGSKEAIDASIDAIDREWLAAPKDELNPMMREILANDASQLLARTMAFHQRAAGEPIFAEIFVTNRYGANVGQTGRTSDFRQNDEEWWTDAWRDGLWVSDSVAFDESADVHSIDIGVRIDALDGEPQGVLKAVLNIAVLRRIIDGFGQRSRLREAFVELVDEHGQLIHRQGEEDSFGEDLSEHLAVMELLAGREGSVIETTDRGDTLRAFVVSQAVASHPTAGWALILNQPTETVFAPLHALTRWTTTVGVVAALIAAFVGYLISVAFARVTERLRSTRDALQGSEAAVRAIVTSVPDGIITADAEGRIESMNPAAERMFGRASAEMVDRNVTQLMPEPYRSGHPGYVERYLLTGEARAIGSVSEVHGQRANGDEFPIELSIGEIRDTERRRFVGIVRDATASREARHALEDAKETAEGASRAKSQFLANMSHELRTPLNAVIGYAEMVAEELGDRGETELVGDVERIRAAGFNLLGLIDDILDLSKIEAGRMEVYAEAFDLNAALDDIVATIQPLMHTNQNTLVVDAPAGLGTVYSDLTKVRQILLNLLSNAAKFTKRGRVRFSAHREPGTPHEWVVFSVSDDGIGMTSAQIATIWDAFAQADASTTRKYGGTGLGLTITRRFAEMLEGTVAVTSREGEGATFTVRLPALLAPRDEALGQTAAIGVPAPPGTETGRDVVLVIDDDPAARDLVRRFLVKEGLDVVEAANGREGLRLARRLLPAVVILDVMMPGMDGWAVLAGLRQDTELAEIPVVMLTMAQGRSLGVALGVDAYLSKPLERDALARALTPYRVDRSRHRILLVEDDEKTREMIGRVLRRDGWVVTEAENGQVALDLLAEHGADLAIVDLMMPVMDGFHLVRAIREDERWRDLPVIIVTAKDITPDDGERLKGSVQEILQKARYSGDELLIEVARQVRRAMRRHAL